MTWETLLLAALGAGAAAIGALGGLGGAVLLVPALVVLGWDPAEAAPLGLLMVAAASLSAGTSQLEGGLVNHRLGVTMELAASGGAVAGALVSGVVSAGVVARLLGVAAIGAAVAGAARSGVRNPPDPALGPQDVGERRGELAGAYALADTKVVPYRARRLPAGLASLTGAGIVAGLTGTSGGFIKTPVMSELMHIPVKVAASTTIFMVGVTASSALTVYAVQGRVDLVAGAAVVAGAALGGRAGATVQDRLPPQTVRRFLGVVLAVVGLLLVVRGAGGA